MHVNTSPLAGQEGKQCTFPVLKKRIEKEMETNVSLVVKPAVGQEAIEISGRGEMQLGILIENMRREGYEFAISPPKVVNKIAEDGSKLEPLEEVVIDVDPEYSGRIIERLAQRHGSLLEMKEIANKSRLVFHVPSRGLVGFRVINVTAFITSMLLLFIVLTCYVV
jgi:GTP-binding protein